MAGLAGVLARVRRTVGGWGLIVTLLILPVYFAVKDLTSGYQAGLVHGHAIVVHNLTQVGENLVQGLSNGMIWALIAIGYTLVYGIIELINFAHGDVFMIGSFATVGLWGTLGLGLATGTLGLVAGLLGARIVARAGVGGLNRLSGRVALPPPRNGAQLGAP